jgi:pimeloyl-ACP methyl ester carboxylesterase
MAPYQKAVRQPLPSSTKDLIFLDNQTHPTLPAATIAPAPSSDPSPKIRKLIMSSIVLLATTGSFLVGTIALGQRSLIFHPRPEPASLQLPPDAQRIPFVTADGPQKALYLPPQGRRPDTSPQRLWVIFSGNASLGIDWLPYLEQDVRPHTTNAFLLVDYPGYGSNAGRPSEPSIQRTVDAVLDALAQHHDWTSASVRRDIRVLGFSLGAAAALKLAVREPVREIILLAPFVNLRQAATEAVGAALALLVIDRFDNRARLREILATRQPPPPLTIYHGTSDRVISIQQGRELARVYGEHARLVEVPGVGHDLRADEHWTEITQTLRR